MDIDIYTKNGIKTLIHSDKKFISTTICLIQRMPLKRSTVSNLAVLADALAAYPSPTELNGRLDDIGAYFYTASVKKGEEQLMTYYIQVPATHTNTAFRVVADILNSTPHFDEKITAAARLHATDRLKALYNNKTDYAEERLIELMCANESFGICPFGCEDDIKGIKPDTLQSTFDRLLRTSSAELYIVGCFDTEKYREAAQCLGCLPQNLPITHKNAKPIKKPTDFYSETGGTEQGVYTSGIRAEGSYAPLLAANLILGGSAQSKLFKAVREKSGLCYYINSAFYRYKNIIGITAGINSANCKAITQITENALCEISQSTERDELERAKAALIAHFNSLYDDPQSLIEFYISQSIADMPLSVSAVTDEISRLESLDGIFDNAFTDTVFMLKED